MGCISVRHLPDWLGDCHYKWPTEVQLEDLGKARLLVVATPPAGLAGLLAESGCLLLENGWCVGFLEDDSKDQSNSGENEGDPAHPTPAKILSDEASDNRTDDCILLEMDSLCGEREQVKNKPGPLSGPILQTEIARARCSSSTKSATIPGAVEIMTLPKKAAIKRTMISAVTDFARAQGMIRIVKMVRQTIQTGFRP